MKNVTVFLICSTALAGLVTHPSPAQWMNSPWNGMVSVVSMPGIQEKPRICALDNQNALIAWHDNRTSTTQTYYQVLNAFGMPLLEANGRAIFEGDWSYGWGGPDLDGLIPDGQGGCIAVVMDNRDGYWDIYGQRFDALGNPLWGPTGMPLAVWPGAPDIGPDDVVSDGEGGFFIVWGIEAGLNNSDLYVQKCNENGDRLWGDYGQPVSTATLNQAYAQAVPDGQGGVLIVWENGTDISYYLYAQHFDANGSPQMAVNGIPILDLFGQQLGAGGLEDGATDGRGGGIWVYTTPGATNHLNVIRVNGRGQLQWLWISPYYASHYIYDVKRHSTANTIWISAGDNRPGAPGLYLYQFDISGHALFGPGGLPYGGDSMSQTSNGMIVFSAYPVGQGTRFYALRVNARGRLAWAINVALSGLQGVFDYPVGTSDGADGAIVAFEDWRQYSSTQIDISAQRVQDNGQLGNPTFPQSVADGEGQSLDILPDGRVQFILSQAGQIKLELFDLLGRKIATLQEGYRQAGMHSVKINELALPSGVYLARLITSSGQQVQKLTIAR